MKMTQDLFERMNQRLSFMKDVAAYKWINNLPVEDTLRERVVIKSAVESAQKAGLCDKSTSLFFQTQIDIAKEIQTSWHEEWAHNGFPDSTKIIDLNKEIRPELIRLGDEIIQGIIETKPLFHKSNREKLEPLILSSITVEHVSDEVKIELLNALFEIKFNTANHN